DPGGLERLAGRDGGDGGGRNAGLRGVALLNARPLHDPFVVRVDELGEVVVGDHPRGRVGPGAEYFDSHSSSFADTHLENQAVRPDSFRSSSTMWSFSLPLMKAAVRLIALVIVRAVARPWHLRTMPRTPRTGAPPCSEWSIFAVARRIFSLASS